MGMFGLFHRPLLVLRYISVLGSIATFIFQFLNIFNSNICTPILWLYWLNFHFHFKLWSLQCWSLYLPSQGSVRIFIVHSKQVPSLGDGGWGYFTNRIGLPLVFVFYRASAVTSHLTWSLPSASYFPPNVRFNGVGYFYFLPVIPIIWPPEKRWIWIFLDALASLAFKLKVSN